MFCGCSLSWSKSRFDPETYAALPLRPSASRMWFTALKEPTYDHEVSFCDPHLHRTHPRPCFLVLRFPAVFRLRLTLLGPPWPLPSAPDALARRLGHPECLHSDVRSLATGNGYGHQSVNTRLFDNSLARYRHFTYHRSTSPRPGVGYQPLLASELARTHSDPPSVSRSVVYRFIGGCSGSRDLGSAFAYIPPLCPDPWVLVTSLFHTSSVQFGPRELCSCFRTPSVFPFGLLSLIRLVV